MTGRNIKKRSFKKNEDAVSPVIGVILMVAITVILAAVIGAFVFGRGPGASAPTINFVASSTGSNTTTLTVMGGDTVPCSDLTFKVGETETTVNGSTTAGREIELTGTGSVTVVDTLTNTVIFKS